MSCCGSVWDCRLRWAPTLTKLDDDDDEEERFVHLALGPMASVAAYQIKRRVESFG